MAATLTDGARLTLTGRVEVVAVRINRQGNREATVTLTTRDGAVSVFVPPRPYADHHELLASEAAVDVDVRVGWWREEITAMAFDIRPAGSGIKPDPPTRELP